MLIIILIIAFLSTLVGLIYMTKKHNDLLRRHKINHDNYLKIATIMQNEKLTDEEKINNIEFELFLTFHFENLAVDR
jgi:hypothetical protein